jgi:hypothetical protein
MVAVNKVRQVKVEREKCIMKLIKTLTAVAAAGLTFSAVPSYAILTLDFSSVVGSTLQFNGAASTFQFNAGVGGNQWDIIAESGTPPPGNTALGLFGKVTPNVGGTYSYGPITTSGIDQFANVLGPLGTLSINDGAGFNLTGTVNWMQVTTHEFVGGINASLLVNLTGLAYLGNNLDLKRTVTEGTPLGGAIDVAFTFNPGKTLSDLTAGAGPYMTAYSGALSVPEPTTMVAGALLLLPFGASTLRILLRRTG